MLKRLSHFALLAMLPVVQVGDARADTAIDFDKDIRPILSDACFHCHGPDANERQADLRLDVEESVFADRGGSAAIVRGSRERSELWKRVYAHDGAIQMPPADSGRRLTSRQIEQIGKWIDEGAKWGQHWAFVAPTRSVIPNACIREWPRNAIDSFVLQRLVAEGLQPAKEADRATLIRRVTLDLTGLPPTIDEIDSFLKDDSADAYERVVDRLLESPHFGERMAVDWLDLARYADTNGYQVDNGRSMWRWRDWVIKAFNNNMPFDQFTTEQIAGDLLPNATLDQQIATGFHRNHPTTFEGGVIPEEYRLEYVIDRVNTTSTVWLGLTMSCARCHDHKYDPFTQRDFYQLSAYFNNVPERGLDGAKGNSVPEIKAPTEKQTVELSELKHRMKAIEHQLTAENSELDKLQIAWESKALAEIPVKWSMLKPETVTSTGGSTLTVLKDYSVLASGANPNADVYEVTSNLQSESITGIRLEGLTHESLPGAGAGRHPNSNFVVTEIQAELHAPDSETAQPIPFAAAYADYSQNNFGIERTIDGDLSTNTGWAVDGPTKRENRVAWLVPEEVTQVANGSKLRIRIHNLYPQAAIGRFRISVTSDPNPYETMQAAPKKNGPSPDIEAILSTPRDIRNADQRRQLQIHFRSTQSTEGQQLARELETAEKRVAEINEVIPTTMVMSEMPNRRDTFVLMRGQYDKKGAKVDIGVPAALHSISNDSPKDRRGLAQWLVDPANPLTARVTVNRIWQSRFGIGLVKTTEDLGVQGERPSHPELLDWLAVEFIESGWDVKQLVRLIVTSATYRQSSNMDRGTLQRDPENRLLARGPRQRLSAEFIRDNALAVSGLLVEDISGESVKPYQPAGLWKEISSGGSYSAQVFMQDVGASLYRRSLYTFWKRASPPPGLQTFDAPTREYCVVGRSSTNTPLQALVLMNDPTYVEASRGLAHRIVNEAMSDDVSRATFAFRVATSRHPTPNEVAILMRLCDLRLNESKANPSAAEKLLAVGEFQPNHSIDNSELAAWTTVASALLNLDETITKP